MRLLRSFTVAPSLEEWRTANTGSRRCPLASGGVSDGPSSPPGLRVEQNRFDDSLKVAAHSGSVIVEHRGYAPTYRAMGCRSQMLDQLPADERADILVIENIVERDSDRTRPSRQRNHQAVEQP